MWIKAFGKIKKIVCLCFIKYVCKALCFVSFLWDNLLLQKILQILCENTIILCVNLIDPFINGIQLVNHRQFSIN